MNIYKIPMAGITLEGEKLKASSLVSGARLGCPLAQLLVNVVWGVPSKCPTSFNTFQYSHPFLAVHWMRKELIYGHVLKRLLMF